MRVRSAIYILLSLTTTFIIPGCEKVINVDLNEAAPRIVIEGLITDRRGPYIITVSKSASYFSESLPVSVTGAKVVITDDFGNIDSLKEIMPGTYMTGRIRGSIGRVYTLKVISDGQVYEATSAMMSHVSIDSLKLVKSQYDYFDLNGHSQTETHLDIHCFFRDPLEKNYYRVRVYKNDSINTESYRLYDDQYTNGEVTELRVGRATKGDTFRIELMSLDKSTYSYFRTLADLLHQNPFFGSTPANPNTNLNNGALGYFGASAISSRTIVITDNLINGIH
jgi:hypothetical protein